MDSNSLEKVPSGSVHLDTVRSLHQTVVSLRTALEISKNELKELKEKYQHHSLCLENTDVIEKLTLENEILRQKVNNSEYDQKDSREKDRNTPSSHFENKGYLNDNNIIYSTSIPSENTEEIIEHSSIKNERNNNFCSADKLNKVSAVENSHNNATEISEITTYDKQESKEHLQPIYNTKLELLSKFDVRIKVKTVKDDKLTSTTDSDSTEDNTHGEESQDTKANFQFKEERKHCESLEDPIGNRINVKTVSTENIKMAVPNDTESKSKADKFDVQVRITSEESLVVKDNVERNRRKDTLNLDVDDLSLRSLSEGDNSVFTEGVATPIDPRAASRVEDKVDNDNASGNESEEVDDIELIFTTDESKDMSNLQEDLVSIRETEHWGPSSASTTHSTPVLIKFHTLDPDFQPGSDSKDNAENENQENISIQGAKAESSLRHKRVSLPSDKDIKSAAFNSKGCLELPGKSILKSYANKSDNTLYRKSPNTSTRRLDSVDSLTTDYNRGLSFDNTKSSSFELDSSMDILHREESMDSFNKNNHLGHRFSIFAETDISKCGISEDDLSGNLNMRRNTCPNPFQYRPPPYRGVGRSGPMKASLLPGRARPVLRETFASRRESAAQTDVSALPPRWSSDGYLAYRTTVSTSVGAPTLPQRSGVTSSRRLTVPDARPPPLVRRSDEARRVMLSDIGFTSMVPELSRSADPVWALSRRAATETDAHSNSTSKFLSRGSSFRSPCASMDRSNEWLPQPLHVPSKANLCPWRSSLPDVRRDDTEELLDEADAFIRRSTDNLRAATPESEGFGKSEKRVRHYIPTDPRQLRLGHYVKFIAPYGQVVSGCVRYVGIIGNTVANSSFVVGVEFPPSSYPGIPRNDGTFKGRRYFIASSNHNTLFVPFSKVVMAWCWEKC